MNKEEFEKAYHSIAIQKEASEANELCRVPFHSKETPWEYNPTVFCGKFWNCGYFASDFIEQYYDGFSWEHLLKANSIADHIEKILWDNREVSETDAPYYKFVAWAKWSNDEEDLLKILKRNMWVLSDFEKLKKQKLIDDINLIDCSNAESLFYNKEELEESGNKLEDYFKKVEIKNYREATCFMKEHLEKIKKMTIGDYKFYKNPPYIPVFWFGPVEGTDFIAGVFTIQVWT